MDTLIPAFLRRQRNKRRLTLEMLSAKVGMSPQHLSEIESGKRDPRLSSIERMAEAEIGKGLDDSVDRSGRHLAGSAPLRGQQRPLIHHPRRPGRYCVQPP
jgi:transcriptional regulator with XRE-family HTH domain